MDGRVRAVDGVSFDVFPSETLGLVGESGCGKTVTGLSLLRLVPSPPGRYAGGEIRFNGRDLLALPESGMRDIRGRDIAMIFQEPMTALNPVFTIGNQMTDVLRRHKELSRRQAREEALALLARVEIPGAGTPHRRVSAPALRRPAPAGDDRDGALLRAEAARGRRADHRARRHDAGRRCWSRSGACRPSSAWP